MISIKKKIFKFVLLGFLFANFGSLNLASYEIKIIKKIGYEVITNTDVKRESQYLLALNKQFESLKQEELLSIAEESIIKEKIKKNEILKFYTLGDQNRDLISNIIKGIYLPLGMQNEINFEKYLKNYNLTLKEIYDKIEIEIVWNQLIYSKYKNQININKELIHKRTLSLKKEKISYNLSEIFFFGESKSEIFKKYEDIKIKINELGFDKASIIYNQSGSRTQAGLLGWVYENQLSNSFRKELKNLEINQFTRPLNVSGGALILKINDKKEEAKEVNYDDEFAKNIKFETEKQLNNFSLIYFNKIRNIIANEQK